MEENPDVKKSESRTAILLHGTGGSDTDYFWFADVKAYLEKQGVTVYWPLLPNTEKPELQPGLTFLQKTFPDISKDTILIGHSSACPLIVAWLEQVQTTIAQAILVGGFYQWIDDGGYSELMLKETYDWQKIKAAAGEIIMINSDNDPWGCTFEAALPAARSLDAVAILNTGEGHMGSTTYNQPYREFDLLKRLIAGRLHSAASPTL
jgi:predicted alpha/beta hydrolase family esterase